MGEVVKLEKAGILEVLRRLHDEEEARRGDLFAQGDAEAFEAVRLLLLAAVKR